MFKRKSYQAFFVSAMLFAGTFLNGSTAALASENTTEPALARTRAWDSIVHTLGGIPETVWKIEYAGSEFYLGEGVTGEDCLAILEGREGVPILKAAGDSGVLYGTPVYLFWNADKTVLMIHQLFFDLPEILTATIIPIDPPASLTVDANDTPSSTRDIELIKNQYINVRAIEGLTKIQTVEYMLSQEYVDAMRQEFYRMLNEYRVSNGLRALEVNTELEKYADTRAAELRTLFSHTRPDGSWAGSGWHNSYNHMNSRYAENAGGTGAISTNPKDTAENMFTRWKKSLGHNAHMLYGFSDKITMAFGVYPEFDDQGWVSSGLIFATGY